MPDSLIRRANSDEVPHHGIGADGRAHPFDRRVAHAVLAPWTIVEAIVSGSLFTSDRLQSSHDV